jgi:hypothetical protein
MVARSRIWESNGEIVLSGGGDDFLGEGKLILAFLSRCPVLFPHLLGTTMSAAVPDESPKSERRRVFN